MSLRKVVVALAILLALGLWSLLVWKTFEQPLDAQQLAQALAQTERVLQAEDQLERELAKARLGRDPELRAVTDAQARWQTEVARLGGRDALWRAKPVVAALMAYAESARSKVERVEDYRIQQRELTAQFERLRQDGAAALARAAGGDAALRDALIQLLNEVASYTLQANPDNGARIDALLAQLDGKVRTLPDLARSLRARKDALQRLSVELAALAGAEKLEALRAALRNHHARVERSARRDRLLLAAYSGALLLVFGLIGWRLRSSFAELDGINANLERLVEQRTQELHQALDDLQTHQAQLVQSEKMASLGQMVAGVAHEINTPLGYARSNVQTVRESLAGLNAPGLSADDQERVTEADVLLADALHGMTQIGELVIGLKNFSRVDRSATELFDLNEGLDTALKICQNQLKTRITVEREYGALPRIPCAPSKLNQVFLNILTNAAQAIDGEGTVRIRTRTQDDHVEVAIRDSGCGMDAETRAHIFEPFFTTKPVGQGTGLGLSISYRIIEDHGGAIRVESAPGQGTEFILTLPRQRAAANPALNETEPAEALQAVPVPA